MDVRSSDKASGLYKAFGDEGASMTVGRLGVIGGAGPMASAYFCERLLRLCQEERGACDDADFLELVLLSQATPGLDAQGLVDPAAALTALRERIASLEALGCNAIAIPCNSLSVLRAQIAAMTSLRVVDIVQAVVDAAVTQGFTRVAVLASPSLQQSGLYPQQLLAAGVRCIELAPLEAAVVEEAILSGMSGRREGRSRVALQQLCAQLAARGAQAVILGCTELPLLNLDPSEAGLPLVDCTEELASSVIHHFFAHESHQSSI
jgi:aspartate racemase